MITLKAAKANFFDRKTVQDAMDRQTLKALSRLGAYVRQRARTSIRRRKGTSQPGSPPFSHTDLLRNFILFSWDPLTRSVVIGPVLLNKGGQAPALLEYGGTATRPHNGKPKVCTYRPRPYMRPALAAELPQLPAHFRAGLSITGG